MIWVGWWGNTLSRATSIPRGLSTSPAKFTPFTIEGAISTTLNDINDAGDLVGAYGSIREISLSFFRRGIDRYYSTRVDQGEARSINNYGVIVGDCEVGASFGACNMRQGPSPSLIIPGLKDPRPGHQ